MSKTSRTSQQRFHRVLVANRGEIAIRIIRSIHELGLESVAVYSDADAQSRHRFAADFAVKLEGTSSADTYINIKKLIAACQASGAEAVHPGYGFLSESHEFAQAVNDAELVFIGPTVQAMQVMGNKVRARELMGRHRIPTVPGSPEPLKDLKQLTTFADQIGLPLMLKAAAGGGGRGMRCVYHRSDLEEAYLACAREAEAYFGNPDVFCERFIENPRHIEFQVLFDEHGQGVHLFERDCSIQRRNQKLIEEAPSTFLSSEDRKRLGDIAVRAASAAGYCGAGTVEFICASPDKAFFMEMNTRIQVEHPVTEMITGIDLISWQIRVAQGEPIPFKQADIQHRGWAFEARINAEDATQDFMPRPGLIQNCSLPGGPFVRVDTHIYPGYKIPSAYDSLIAKVLAWGTDREDAICRLRRALRELRVEGVPTTTPFHLALLENHEFLSGDFHTGFLDKNGERLSQAITDASLSKESAALAGTLMTALSTHQSSPPTEGRSLWGEQGRLEGVQR